MSKSWKHPANRTNTGRPWKSCIVARTIGPATIRQKPDLAWEVLSYIDIDAEQLKADMEDPAIAAVLKQDMADVTTLNVQKTPGFYVNGKPLTSFGYQQLKDLIETEIRVQYGS